MVLVLIWDALKFAAILHARLAHATTRPAGSGRSRKAPRLIAGLIPEATGPMDPDMRAALDERRELIENRATHSSTRPSPNRHRGAPDLGTCLLTGGRHRRGGGTHE